MSKVHYLDSYSPSSSDVYFFDNNIWMLLQCPISDVRKKQQAAYSGFLSQLITRRCTIFINSLVLSEFANSYLRLDFNLWKKQPENVAKDFKRDFTQTSRYQDTVKNIKLSIDGIMKICQAGSDEFNSIDFSSVLSKFGRLDFNDAYYLSLCVKKNWKLVTEDQDIVNYQSEANIITTK